MEAKTFLPTHPCKRGHIGPRYESNGACVRCVIDDAAAWARAHPDRAKVNRQRFSRLNPTYQPEWRIKNAAKSKAYRRAARLRKIPPSRPMPLACECCGVPQGGTQLCLDHDHTTGQFRGWLCHRCNTAIGQLGDTLNGVMRAVRYLTPVAV